MRGIVLLGAAVLCVAMSLDAAPAFGQAGEQLAPSAWRGPVIIDTDPGVDDIMALALAAGSPELDLRGVTAVGGNVGVRCTWANAWGFLHLLGRSDIPVHAGAGRPLARDVVTAEHVHGESGVRSLALPAPPEPAPPETAASAIINAAHMARDAGEAPLTIAALGPLTNVAQAILQNPEIADAIRVVWMGGAFGGSGSAYHDPQGNITRLAEFNAHADPHAAELVLSRVRDVTIIPLDVTHRTAYGESETAWLRAHPAGGALAEMLDQTRADHPAAPAGTAPLHDPHVILFLLRPDLYEWRSVPITVETAGERMGATAAAPGAPGRPAVRAVASVDVDGFWREVKARILRALSNAPPPMPMRAASRACRP